MNAFRIIKEVTKGFKHILLLNFSKRDFRREDSIILVLYSIVCILPHGDDSSACWFIIKFMWITYGIPIDVNIKLIELCDIFFTHNKTYTVGRYLEILILYLALKILFHCQVVDIPPSYWKVCTHFLYSWAFLLFELVLKLSTDIDCGLTTWLVQIENYFSHV